MPKFNKGIFYHRDWQNDGTERDFIEVSDRDGTYYESITNLDQFVDVINPLMLSRGKFWRCLGFKRSFRKQLSEAIHPNTQ